MSKLGNALTAMSLLRFLFLPIRATVELVKGEVILGTMVVSYSTSDTFESLFAKLSADLQGKSLVVEVYFLQKEDIAIRMGEKDLVYMMVNDCSSVSKIRFSGKEKNTFLMM